MAKGVNWLRGRKKGFYVNGISNALLPPPRHAQPGVATGQSVLAWRLGCAEVFSNKPMMGQLGQNQRPLRPAALGHQGFTLKFWVLPSFFS